MVGSLSVNLETYQNGGRSGSTIRALLTSPGEHRALRNIPAEVLKSRSLLPSPSLVFPELKIFVAYVVWVYKARRILRLQTLSLT